MCYMIIKSENIKIVVDQLTSHVNKIQMNKSNYEREKRYFYLSHISFLKQWSMMKNYKHVVLIK